jgi:hypothetical protein
VKKKTTKKKIEEREGMCLEKLPDGSRLHTHTHTPLERDKKTTEKNFFSLTHRTERAAAAAGTVPAFFEQFSAVAVATNVCHVSRGNQEGKDF